MTKIGIARMAYALELKLTVDFTFQTSHIYTITNKEFKKLFPEPEPISEDVFGVKFPEQIKEDSQYGYLIIDATFDVQPYDSILEGSAKIRPQLLVIHGILTFLANKVFITFQSSQSVHGLVQRHILSSSLPKKFSVGKTDYKEELKRILEAIVKADSNKKVLLFTLFERWRKALHFEEESIESYSYTDESVLAYVHILEVLSDEYKKGLEVDIKSKKNELITEIINCAKGKENKSLREVNRFLNLLSSNQITLKFKINFMLKELNLYGLKSEAIVSRFIDHRNSIAHGRKNLYQDKVVFPLKPFFSFIKDNDENIEAIKILSAKAISTYLNLHMWDMQWKILLAQELTPFSLVKEFIDSKNYLDITITDFKKGKVDEITPFTLAYYCIKNKITIQTLELILEEVLVSSKITKSNSQALFDASVLLSDSCNILLANKCREFIKAVHENNWGYYSNIRDVLKDYEYHNINLVWFGQWLTSRTKK